MANIVTLIVLILALKQVARTQDGLVWCPPDCARPTVDPCQPNPCLYGGQCVLTIDKKDYQCINCPNPTGGKKCEDLTCGPDCFKVGDTVYFIYPNPNKAFSDSYAKCLAEGMRLAIFKDPGTHGAVRRYFAARNVDFYKDELCYWMGLSRAFSAAPWKWADGTDLGSYQPWFLEPETGNNCADICSARWTYNFSADACSSGHPNWKYFSLCEKTLPITLD